MARCAHILKLQSDPRVVAVARTHQQATPQHQTVRNIRLPDTTLIHNGRQVAGGTGVIMSILEGVVGLKANGTTMLNTTNSGKGNRHRQP